MGELIGGRYRIVRRISAGGMGIVCEGVHDVTGRRVALKIIRDTAGSGSDQAAWRARFNREARAAGTIDTPHIAQVFDASTDTDTGQAFIAMELLDGRDLNRTLKAVGPLPVDVALKIVAQACIGLECAHDAGVIHRDIKPGNVFLSEDRDGGITVKLVDFGIAKVVDEPTVGEGGELTQTGSLLGTPTYMSPEQAKGLKTIDERTDIWALGVVLYKALSNTVPHRKGEGGLGQLIITVCTEQAPSIQSRAPWVPPEVARIIDGALRLDPEQRYRSAHEMREDIEKLLGSDFRLHIDMIRALADDERQQVARRYDSAFPPPDPAAVAWTELDAHDGSLTQPGIVQAPVNPVRRRSWPWVGAAVVVALAGAGTWWTTRRARIPAPPSTAETAPAPATPPPAPSAAMRVVKLGVKPAESEVTVDGSPSTLSDGKLSLEGKLGSTFEVRVAAKGQDRTFTVVIGQQGAVPDVLELPDESPEPSSKPVIRGASKSRRRVPASKPKPAKVHKAKPSNGVGVTSSFE